MKILVTGGTGYIGNAVVAARTIAEVLSRGTGCGGKVVTPPLAAATQSMGSFAVDQQISGVLAERLLGWEPKHRSIVAESDSLFRSYRAGA